MKWLREHSLSLVLGSILAVQLWFYFKGAAAIWMQSHNQLGWGFWRLAFTEVNLSMLADTYGALILVLLTKWFWERGSNQ